MYNISFQRKTDNVINIDITDLDTFSIGMYTLFLTVRKNIPPTSQANDDDTDVVIKKTVSVTLSSAQTNILFAIPISDVELDIDPREYFYDIKIKNPGGEIVSVIPTSIFSVLADITRRIV